MPTPDPTPVQINDRGDETHPSFATCIVNRSNYGGQGVSLFDSSVKHSETITLRIATASRNRSLHHDHIHSDRHILEVEMSTYQWGQLVSSFGVGSGVPVTLRYREGQIVPRAVHKSRLAVSAEEVAATAREATADLAAAADAVAAAFENKAGRRELGALIADLTRRAQQLPGNMAFTAKSFNAHSEKVVAQAQADIQAGHLRAARAAAEAVATERAFAAAGVHWPSVEGFPNGEVDRSESEARELLP